MAGHFLIRVIGEIGGKKLFPLWHGICLESAARRRQHCDSL